MAQQFMQKKCNQLILLLITKKICLSLHCNGDNSYLFVNGKEIHKFKAKDSEIVPYPLCLGGLYKDFEVGYMRASGLIGYVLTLVLILVLLQLMTY